MKLRLCTVTLVAACFGLTASAQAASKDDALAAIAKCATLADDHARLACFDAAVPAVEDALAMPPAAQAAETTKEKESWFGLPDIFGGSGHEPQTTPQQFGNENLPPPPPKPGEAAPPAPVVIDSISATVTDYAFHLDGRFTIFLDNGQIWQQLRGDTDKAQFRRTGPNTAVISRGSLGSYDLVLNDGNRSFKVKRVK